MGAKKACRFYLTVVCRRNASRRLGKLAPGPPISLVMRGKPSTRHSASGLFSDAYMALALIQTSIRRHIFPGNGIGIQPIGTSTYWHSAVPHPDIPVSSNKCLCNNGAVVFKCQPMFRL
jgi:hypothetical protein